MAFQLDWEYDDAAGNNPLNKPGIFEFNLEFEFCPGTAPVLYLQSGDGDPGTSPEFTITQAECHSVDFYCDEAVPRGPTENEKAALDPWFLYEIERDAKLKRQIRETCVGLVDFDPDWDGLDD